MEEGFPAAWDELILSIDPEGETHAYKVRSVSLLIIFNMNNTLNLLKVHLEAILILRSLSLRINEPEIFHLHYGSGVEPEQQCG